MQRLVAADLANTQARPDDLAIPVAAIRPSKFHRDDSELNGWLVETGLVDTAQYNTVRLQLSATGVNGALVTWAGNLEPDAASTPGIQFPIVPDGQVREYVVNMIDPYTPLWCGTITQLAIIPVNTNGNISVKGATFANTPVTSPLRVTLDFKTISALTAPDIAWDVTVPPRGVLEFSTGLAKRAWKLHGSDGVVFRVRVATSDGKSRVLTENTREPMGRGRETQWVPIQADLGDYAGQQVRLTLETDPRQNSIGDYAYWGNPTVRSSAPDNTKSPVILISCDTTRVDRLPLYGYARDTWPNLTSFGKEAVLFEKAFTPETWTLTAHVSMLTGLYPTHHHVNSTTNLAESVVTLPEVLANAGYVCGGFTGYRTWLLPWRGLAHGFDAYETAEVIRDIRATQAHIDPWLEQHKDQPFFLFFHNYDHHSKIASLNCAGCDLPYYPVDEAGLHFSKELKEPSSLRAEGRPRATDLLFGANDGRETISPEELTYMSALYDDAVRSVDEELGAFFDQLKASGAYDRALIIVTADHGELFGEHGEFLHEHVYEGAAHVPLLIRFPGGKDGGKRVSDIAQLIDLYPTVLDFLKLPAVETDGRSLLPLLNGPQPNPTVFIRRQHYQAARTTEWKLIHDIQSGGYELYDMVNDPRETQNVYAVDHPAAPELTAELNRFFVEDPRGWHVAFVNKKKWHGTVVLSTEDQIDAARLFFGGTMSREDLMKRDERSFTVNLGSLPREEILFRTNPSSSEVRLSVRSETPFQIILPDGKTNESATYDGVLIPPKAGASTKPQIPSHVKIPTLVVWYENEAAEGTKAPEMTAEEKEELRGGGYVGE
ncbi:MAG: sulfatase [Candidatus Hydrogenedentes bacterium]|nr:sulfatase [Candidatus Hydrogenedentota bacterium]